jgi:biotin carboxylase
MNSGTKGDIIIIDAFSTGKTLAKFLKQYGHNLIHIKSSPALPSRFQHNPEDFSENLEYTGDINNIEQILTKYKKIIMCVPGSESGVELADLLSERLGLPTNGTEFSKARRNKFEMIDKVAAAGIPTVKHYKANNVEDIIEWWDKELKEDRIVLKPLESASGDNVFFCHNRKEIIAAFEIIIKDQNLFGEQNIEVLAESFNQGCEYIVNTVSSHGFHIVTEIWRINKKPGTLIYDTAEIVHENEEEFEKLFNYAKQVLDALHIQYGACTTELKYTKQDGPKLIETGARMMGAAPVTFSNELAGCSQVSLMADAYLSLDKEEFMACVATRKHNKKFYGMAVILISYVLGTLTDDLDTSDIEKLKTYHSKAIAVKKGDSLPITVDSLTAPGEIYLFSTEKEELLEDYRALRDIEANKLYVSALRHNNENSLQNSIMSYSNKKTIYLGFFRPSSSQLVVNGFFANIPLMFTAPSALLAIRPRLK